MRVIPSPHVAYFEADDVTWGNWKSIHIRFDACLVIISDDLGTPYRRAVLGNAGIDTITAGRIRLEDTSANTDSPGRWGCPCACDLTGRAGIRLLVKLGNERS